MVSQRLIESLVGLFIICAGIALSVLAFKVSGLTNLFPGDAYTISAEFDDIGGLKVRAPVKISGVQVGEVTKIILNPTTFKAQVTMKIRDKFDDIPDDSTAGIFTSGLLGDNYIAISPMYSQNMLKNGSKIEITRSAMILEKLIGQLIYKVSGGSNSNNASTDAATKKS